MNKTQFTTKTLTCVDCGKTFQFSSGETAFFWSKRLSEPLDGALVAFQHYLQLKASFKVIAPFAGGLAKTH